MNNLYTPELKVKRLHPDASLPVYATDGAACFDIHALITKEGVTLPLHQDIWPGKSRVIHTGLAFEVPPGWALMVYSRSGHGFKYSVRLANGTGILDSDYRGELMIAVRNDGDQLFSVASGDRIAQAMLIAAPKVAIVEVDELSDTARGAGGFGSTGK